MLFAEVECVLDALEEAGVRYWLAGGWGVAALVGRQTRAHRDLDLAVDAQQLDECLDALEALGYQRETDWLPVRVELGAEGRGWVDVHPVDFTVDGHGRQQGLDGEHFDYPPSAWTTGSLHGRTLRCLSIQQQRLFHSGYEQRPEDVHDVTQLECLDG